MSSIHEFPKEWESDPRSMERAEIAHLRAWRGVLRENLWTEIGGYWCDAESFAATMDQCDIGDFGGNEWAGWWRDAHADLQIVGHANGATHRSRVRALYLYKLTVCALCKREQAELRAFLSAKEWAGR